MEKDAATLKPVMAAYLESLTGAIETNGDDLDELRLIHQKLQQDRSVLTNVEAKLMEQINFSQSLKTKNGEIMDALAVAIRLRKE